MSLKAKLEAVIYAAEEPVTLAQLAGLFTDEALEWKAEQDAARAAQSEAEKLPLLHNAFDYGEREQGAEDEAGAAPAAEAAGESSHAANDSGNGGATGEEQSETQSKADEAAAAKQEAKLREREARTAIKQVLGELIAEYAADGRGIEIREIAGGYRMATKPEFHDAVRSFVKSLKPAMKLSLPALETLAVIAYKQPVTAPEVNEIRGVDSSGVFGSLLARKLIATAGRKQVIGRPILYKTTREFLLRFGLKDVSELPSMEEFEKMASLELDEPEPSPGTESTAATTMDFDFEAEETDGESVVQGISPELSTDESNGALAA